MPNGYQSYGGYGRNMLTGGTDASPGIANSFGDDYIAGGAGNDEIFGQLGNDTIQGDGTIDRTSYAVVDNGAGQMVSDPTDGGGRVGVIDIAANVANNPFRNANDELVLRPSFDSAATDGNDYIEAA